jgi:hypothetical protein
MKVSRFGKDGILEKHEFSTIREAKLLIEKWKEEFKIVNRTREVIRNGGKDYAYERYCQELDDMIERLKQQNPPSPDYYRCKKCKEKDHESFACRCEDRNIRISKERRERGEGWKNE